MIEAKIEQGWRSSEWSPVKDAESFQFNQSYQNTAEFWSSHDKSHAWSLKDTWIAPSHGEFRSTPYQIPSAKKGLEAGVLGQRLVAAAAHLESVRDERESPFSSVDADQDIALIYAIWCATMIRGRWVSYSTKL